jgi:LPXTG-motif cell wall-anchored protein
MSEGGKSRRRTPAANRVAPIAAVLALALLPATALGQGPASEEYNLDIPEAGASGAGGGESPGGSGGTAPPPAEDESTTSVPADPAPIAEGGDQPAEAATGAGSSAGGHSDDGGRHADESKESESGGFPLGPVAGERANSLPTIATDVASEGGVPILLAGLAALLALAGFVVYRRRRAQTLEVS